MIESHYPSYYKIDKLYEYEIQESRVRSLLLAESRDSILIEVEVACYDVDYFYRMGRKASDVELPKLTLIVVFNSCSNIVLDGFDKYNNNFNCSTNEINDLFGHISSSTTICESFAVNDIGGAYSCEIGFGGRYQG
ncbi:MAG: hypothetical protein KDA78_19710, partial [Planctomycetaceae bacterium]|nr:hypothetical protein [Planctomycetaceae bacterium]